MKNVKMSYKLMILVLAAGILPLIVGIYLPITLRKVNCRIQLEIPMRLFQI